MIVKVLDLFCGCGGMSLGFYNAKYEIIAAYDNWDLAVDNYAENFTHPVRHLDLAMNPAAIVKEMKAFKPDVIIGGPPCQDFSGAGLRDETRGNASLTIAFASIIALKQPKWCIMENVGITRTSPTYQRAMKMLYNAGYSLHHVIIDAIQCNVPQYRRRLFMIAELNSHHWNILGHLKAGLSSKARTIRQHFGGKFEMEHFYHHQRNYKNRSIYSVNEASPTIRGQNRPVPKNYNAHPKDTAPSSESRSFNALERASIQTFPEHFKFHGANMHIDQMIGNAVAPNVAEYIANTLKPIIKETLSK